MENILHAVIIATIVVVVFHFWKALTKKLLKDESDFRHTTVLHGSSLFANSCRCIAIFSLDQLQDSDDTVKAIVRVDFEVFNNTENCARTLVWTRGKYKKKEICRIYSPGHAVFYVAYAKYLPKQNAVEVSVKSENPKN